MRMLFDFNCATCGETFEALVQPENTEITCRGTDGCSGVAIRLMPATTSFTLIQATHNKSLKLKAGFVHSHGDRPKTPGKIQVGYGTTNHSS